MATIVVNQGATFSTSDTKLYDPVLTVSTQDNAKLLEQLKPCFKITINWNTLTERPKQYLDYLIDHSYKGKNRLFVLLFKDSAQRTSYKRYFFRR